MHSSATGMGGWQAREVHEPGFGALLRSFGADSSSPQISEILVGRFTRGK